MDQQNSEIGITVERLERALAVVAVFVFEDGAPCAWAFERLEAEYEKRCKNDPVERARRFLEKKRAVVP